MSQQQPMPPSHLRGAVDLSGLAQRRPAAGGPAGAGAVGQGAGGAGTGGPAGGAQAGSGQGSWVIEGADAGMLQQLVQLSSRVPVLLVLADDAKPESGQLTRQFADAVDAQGGRLVMAVLDAAADPRLAQAFGVASAPVALALVAGQPVPLVDRPLPQEQVAPLMQELLSVAQQNGMTATVPPVAEARANGDAPQDATAEEGPSVPPEHRKAHEALAAGDLEAAVAAWQEVLDTSPQDAVARQGLAAARLMARTQDMDAREVRRRGAEEPDSPEAQNAVADLDVLGGHAEDAFTRLVRFIAAHRDETRDPVRERLLELYEVVGTEDPRVAASRRRLASALF